MTEALTYTVVFGIPALLGLRATWRLWRIYLFDGESRSQVILLSFAVVATLITGAAFWFGGLTLRLFLGYEPIPWTRPVGLIVAAVILMIPAGLEWLVGYIGRRDGPRGG